MPEARLQKTREAYADVVVHSLRPSSIGIAWSPYQFDKWFNPRIYNSMLNGLIWPEEVPDLSDWQLLKLKKFGKRSLAVLRRQLPYRGGCLKISSDGHGPSYQQTKDANATGLLPEAVAEFYP